MEWYYTLIQCLGLWTVTKSFTSTKTRRRCRLSIAKPRGLFGSMIRYNTFQLELNLMFLLFYKNNFFFLSFFQWQFLLTLFISFNHYLSFQLLSANNLTTIHSEGQATAEWRLGAGQEAGGRRAVSLQRGLGRETRTERDWRTRQQVTETLFKKKKKMDVSVTWKCVWKCVSVSNGPRRKLRWDAFIHSLRVTCGSKLAPVSLFFFL